MRFLYLLIILFFGAVAVRGLTIKYDIKKSIKWQEDKLRREKELLEDEMFGEEFKATMCAATAIIAFFIQAVVFCFAMIGFKSVFD